MDGSAAKNSLRTRAKARLAPFGGSAASRGASILIYHRVGGGTSNELDLTVESFRQQVKVLAEHDVVSLDTALDRLEAGESSPSAVLTFDDGFEDVYANAWPLLRDHRLPFTIYVATDYMGTTMKWEGATATGPAGHGLSWQQLEEMVASGLCTIGNHTHHHVRPERLTEEELDTCTATLQERLGVTPRHFTYPWGLKVPAMEPALRARFRSASTGELGRNLPGADPIRLRRIPVRRTDPEAFFQAKLSGNLLPERAYAGIVRVAKTFGPRR